MSDVFTEKKRSEVMSKIRGRGNKGTELRLASLLRKAKISGWRRHIDLPGRPDFAFPKQKIAVFVDGCFWHGCPTCYKAPKNNAVFWRTKIGGNKKRDRQVSRRLRRSGWSVVRAWECRLQKSPASVVSRIRRQLKKTQ